MHPSCQMLGFPDSQVHPRAEQHRRVPLAELNIATRVDAPEPWLSRAARKHD